MRSGLRGGRIGKATLCENWKIQFNHICYSIFNRIYLGSGVKLGLILLLTTILRLWLLNQLSLK